VLPADGLVRLVECEGVSMDTIDRLIDIIADPMVSQRDKSNAWIVLSVERERVERAIVNFKK